MTAITAIGANVPRTGWYGKLPTLGDFASRRLAPELIEAWDDWLADGLAAWRAQDGDGWLGDYLDGPSWRFVLPPGLLPAQPTALAGVLMPSVDRVGRYFPFSLLRPLPARPAAEGQVLSQPLLSWLHRLDDLAIDAMQDDWEVAELERELEKLDAEPPACDGQPVLPLLEPGQACWWREDELGRPQPWITRGLPTGAALIALLRGAPWAP